MEVINARASLLSNFEVLTLLRELESDFLAKTKTALRVKKEEEAAGTVVPKAHDPIEDISENLRTVEVEAIQYLSADYQPTNLQTEKGIAKLVKELGSFTLNKSEKLQIVNLAPTEAVELYVIVEELEDRLGDKMEDVLTVVRSSLKGPTPTDTETQGAGGGGGQAVFYSEEQVYQEEMRWENDANDLEFDDVGEGAGVEGDLDVDDD